MKSITITLLTLPNGTLSVRTDGAPPTVGQQLTASESLHLELMNVCARQVKNLRYGPDTVPLIALAKEMIDREGFGHCLPKEAHAYVRRILEGATT